MKKLTYIIPLILLSACSESTPTIDELVENDDLYQKVRAECRGKPIDFEDIKCMNFRKAADKRSLKDIKFPELK